MSSSVAVVGMGCRFPDARSPLDLWDNVLARRRAFRRIPDTRLSLHDYFAADPAVPDSLYADQAAVIEDYEFDRVHFRIVGSTYRSADTAHWLALDIAAQALADAGFQNGEGLPRQNTGVIVGNTLTGDSSRANVMRLRWPYVRRVLDASLQEAAWTAEKRGEFLERIEERYKSPFPQVGEETLAGGLSNTIAGRICNHFNLNGGGYTVDGACSASLLAITNACTALTSGDLDVALAGGVDLSIDPFELVGFAKTGALAREEMRVYDARSAGFWPGEGCGFLVLMRPEDAVAEGRRIYAVIRGWGISSDGSGGITRPEVEGQLIALKRAYNRAGFLSSTVGYFEGHGTGTAVGDAVELDALCTARRMADRDAAPAAIGSVKANIGHTKAAAGIAGAIKAIMAVHRQILPPTTGCDQPHPELTCASSPLRILQDGEPWPANRLLRAGVSAMGFGGINSHITLEGAETVRRTRLSAPETIALASHQDAELFLLDGADAPDMLRKIDQLLTYAAQLSRAELADLSAKLAAAAGAGPVRAAVVASLPRQLATGLARLRGWLSEGLETRLDISAGIHLNTRPTTPRIGLLFPGQGSPAHLDGGLWRRRFEAVRALYPEAGSRQAGSSIATEVAQPAIVTASLAAVRILRLFGVEATVAVGHSLGELSALYWAGACDEETILRIARARGNAMARLGAADGAMASIGASPEAVGELLTGTNVVIAGYNAPRQTVVSGRESEIQGLRSRAQEKGLLASRLPVSHAFHSPLVADAVPSLAAALSDETFEPLKRQVASTITGSLLSPDEDLHSLLCRQITVPVRFTKAFAAASDAIDLWIEAGPGEVLSGLAGKITTTPIIPLDAGGASLSGLLQAAGAAYVLGAPVDAEALHAGRFVRPFDLNWKPRFFASPCEMAPPTSGAGIGSGPERQPDTRLVMPSAAMEGTPAASDSPLEMVRRLIAAKTELPLPAIQDDSRFLSDLHLNSIAVGQIISEAARSLGLSAPADPTDYANATVLEAARALEEIASTGVSNSEAGGRRAPAGVDSWIRAFTVELVPGQRPVRSPHSPDGDSLRGAELRFAESTGAVRGAPICSSEGEGVTDAKACAPEKMGACRWKVIGPAESAPVSRLQEALALVPGHGVVLCLPPNSDECPVELFMESARAVLDERDANRYVVVQHGGGGAAFAKTLHLEHPGITVCVVDIPADHPRTIEWVAAEAVTAIEGYSEAHYDCAGIRRVPNLRLLSDGRVEGNLPLQSDDVLLVTGGGKGIAAECALALGRETGAALAIMGRSHPDADAELAANLKRMVAAGLRVRYVVADVCDAGAVRRAVKEAESALGPVTAILHGAGTNVPRLLRDLDEASFRQSLDPKVVGARNVLAAVDPTRLRLLITFGSLIARTGLRGEADYAVANEWLARLTEEWQRTHTHCRCLALEWSVWSGVGMAERLGRLDTLVAQGITPIPPDEGTRILCSLLRQTLPCTSVVVTGRFGAAPTLAIEQTELPFQRFLEQPRVFYPGVELIVDANLSSDTDPYLADHVFEGEQLVPGVIGLEAAAQAAMAVTGCITPPRFEAVHFLRPIIVPPGESLTIRIAALVRSPRLVEVVLRSSGTSFQTDHFCVTARFDGDPAADQSPNLAHQGLSLAAGEQVLVAQQFPELLHESLIGATRVPLEPLSELYGDLFFHKGRFRRVQSYVRLRSQECIVEISPDAASSWFGPYLPSELTLGDPAMRDAAIHAVQACIPQSRLLPAAVESITISAIGNAAGPCFMHARERERMGDTFVYDLAIYSAGGELRERWNGLHLHRMDSRTTFSRWPAPLFGPYIERRVAELVPGTAACVVTTATPCTDRRKRSDGALQQAAGRAGRVHRRPDGRPELEGPGVVSASHCGNLTAAVHAPGTVACDTETVVSRNPATWADLLGTDRLSLAQLLARQYGEALDEVCTRVWSAAECLKKAGAMIDSPLLLHDRSEDGWIVLSSGGFRICTWVTDLLWSERRTAFAILVRAENANL